ncbi:hypothetical protein Hanom_Chr15g01354011 [Helianthus anomalus]
MSICSVIRTCHMYMSICSIIRSNQIFHYYIISYWGLVVGDLGFPLKNQVQFTLVSYWGGYWTMMVTNPSRGA